MDQLIENMERLHISPHCNKYAHDYQCIKQLLDEMDDMRSLGYFMGEISLDAIFAYRSHYCYKYFADSDLINSHIAIIPANLRTFQHNYEHIMKYTNPNYSTTSRHMAIDNGTGALAPSEMRPALHIHPDNYATFLLIYAHFHNISNYFAYECDIAYIPQRIMGDMQAIIAEMEMERVSLNPLNICYDHLTEFQFETFILLVLAVRHIKILCHIFRNTAISTVTSNEIRTKILRLLHNFTILIVNIIFT
jgi:hypothetical protein